MSYRLTDYGKGRRALAGVPWRDLTDDEMAAAEARYPGIGGRGYFEQEQPAVTPLRPAVPRRSRGTGEPVEAIEMAAGETAVVNGEPGAPGEEDSDD
jgi:hypothetical protein